MLASKVGWRLFGLGVAVSLMSPQCNTVSAQTDIDASFTLLGVQVIARHGLRTPMSGAMPQSYKDYNWECVDKFDPTLLILDNKDDGSIATWNYADYATAQQILDLEKVYGNCAIQQLTKSGERQAEELGKFLRSRYVHELKFMDNRYDEDNLYVRSTGTERTIWTARRIVNGLYPEETKSEGDKTSIHIKFKDNMIPYDCAMLDELRKKIKRDSTVRTEARKARDILFDKVENEAEKKYWKSRSISGICNNLQSFYLHNFPLPTGISLSEIDYFCQLSGKEYSHIYGSDEQVLRLGIGRFIEDIHGHAHPDNNAHPPFSIYVGHDNTLGPLVTGLRLVENEHPPMASALIIETWKDNMTTKKYFQILYRDTNGVRPLQHPSCSREGLCDLDVLLNSFQNFIPVHYENECRASRH